MKLLTTGTRISRQSTSCVCTPVATRSVSSSSQTRAELSLPVSNKDKAKAAAWDSVMDTVQQRRAESYTTSKLDSLGSTQTRSTVWTPHQSLHAPPTPVSLTQSHLVASGAHLGHSSSLTHRAFLPHIYGTRSGLSYIDIRQTLPALRRAAQVVRGVVENDGIVVFVGSLKGAERAVWENAKRLGENGYGVTRWLPGSISNAGEVYGFTQLPQPEGYRATPVTPASFKPSLVVLLSPTLNQHALREATANEIPTIGICDSDVDPRCVTYSIPANDDSIRTVELIAGVLGMAGKDGLTRKEERQEALAKIAKRVRAAERRSRNYGEEAA
ncbi:small subunit ribosomal protein S2 [Pseudohyphozyma bogoriensis]|nr:small subunit ribosomal protein S2 [Pseudohyphozyma bogoriensis]